MYYENELRLYQKTNKENWVIFCINVISYGLNGILVIQWRNTSILFNTYFPSFGQSKQLNSGCDTIFENSHKLKLFSTRTNFQIINFSAQQWNPDGEKQNARLEFTVLDLYFRLNQNEEFQKSKMHMKILNISYWNLH